MSLHRSARRRALLRSGFTAICWLLFAPATTWAQAGSIAGVVRDTTGAILPGVTVEAASPALIERVRTAVSDGQGQYRILDLRPGSVVQQAALAGQAIQVGIDSWAGSLTAPEITTTGRMTDFHELADPRNSIEIAPPSRGELPELGCVRGFKLEKLIPLGAETWVYDGSLALPVPVYLHSKLVVRGSFQCPAGSLLGDDVKTGDTMRIGAGSICKGNLTARAELILERDCVFEAELRGDRTVRLSQGVRGVNPSGLVRAEARQDLILEPNVVVRGQLAAAGRVVGAEPAIEGGLELLLAEG